MPIKTMVCVSVCEWVSECVLVCGALLHWNVFLINVSIKFQI